MQHRDMSRRIRVGIGVLVSALLIGSCGASTGDATVLLSTPAEEPVEATETPEPTMVEPTAGSTSDIPTSTVAAPPSTPTAAAAPPTPTHAPPSPTPTVPPTNEPSPTEEPPPASKAREESALKRRDIPPEGVSAQFAFGGRGDEPCVLLGSGQPDPSFADGLAQAHEYCLRFGGFDPGEVVQLTLWLPDGSSRVAEFTSDLHGSVVCGFIAVPGDPTGTYVVTASVDGQEILEDRFEVTRAVKPSLLIRDEANISMLFELINYEVPPSRPGSAFELVFAGWQAHELVDINVYFYDSFGECYFIDETVYYAEHPCVYITSFQGLEMDESGVAIYVLDTQSDDPQGTYYFAPVGNVSEASSRQRFVLKGDPPMVASFLPTAETLLATTDFIREGPPWDRIPMLQSEGVVESWQRTFYGPEPARIDYNLICAQYDTPAQADAATDADIGAFLEVRSRADVEAIKIDPIGDAWLAIRGGTSANTMFAALWFIADDVGCRFLGTSRSIDPLNYIVSLGQQVTGR